MSYRIGHIGAGVMGGGMARRALATGNQVSVCDLRAEIREDFARLGARVVNSAAGLGALCDVVVLSLPRAEDVEAACFGPDGLVASLRPGTVVIDASSTPPEGMERLNEAVRARGARVVDAPLCPSQNRELRHRPNPPGSEHLNAGGRAACAGNLCFFVGGAPEDVAAARPVLDLLGIQSHHVGPLGAGKLVKLLHNAINITALAAISETMVVAERSGLDVAVVVDALITSLADSAMLRNQGRDYIAARKFPKGLYPLPFSEKDVAYALRAAHQVGLTPTVIGATHALYARACASPWRDYYNPAIFRFIKGDQP